MECNYVLVLGNKASSEDDEDEVISPSEDTTKPFGYDENKPEGGEDEEMVGRYFETLGTSSPAQKADEQVTEPPPLDTDRLMRTRLSISARFLSRSHQPGRIGVISTNLDEEKGENYHSDDSKQDLQRRKEEMAQAVEATRKRLEALGWKAKEDILKKMPVNSATSTATITSVSSVSSTTVISSSKSTTISSNSGSSPSTAAEEPASKTSTVLSSVSTTHTSSVSATSKTSTVTTSMSFTPTTVVNSASGSGKNGDSTPVSALTESSSKPSVITNLLETRLADVQENSKEERKDQSAKKDIPESKKDNVSKADDTEKSKRTASNLIAFFSQSKSSKNKDKEKENSKEKERAKSKEKDKEKGRATPPLVKEISDLKSTSGGKLERRGSEGKSWRKSLGILGGSSKHDKEDKHKRHSEPRSSTPPDMLSKNALKQNEREDKLNKKPTEPRSSTPPVDKQMKNSQPAKHHESTLKTVKEEKDKKSPTKPQPERRSSNTSSELAGKTSQPPGAKTNETSLTTSSRNAPLREKKGRVSSEERREKSRSLGDIGSRLHKVEEVSILDPSVPPSRTVDTMDIPNQIKTAEKRPKSSAGILETTPPQTKKPLERNSVDNNDVSTTKNLKEHTDVLNGTSDKNDISTNGSLLTSNEYSTGRKPPPDEQLNPALDGPGNEAIPVLGSTLEKKSNTLDLGTSKPLSPRRTSRSGSGSSFMSDISELSAELSAAIASPPPEPLRLSVSESNLLSTSPPSTSRKSSTDAANSTDIDQNTCQETLEHLVQAFQKVMDVQSKILNGEPSDDNHQLLSYITSTFSAIEEQIHDSRLRRRKWELSYLPWGKPGTAPRPLGGALSFSTGNLDQVGSKLRPFRRTSELSVSSIPEEEVEIHEVLLEKYSDRLLEMVAKKLKQ